MSNGTLRVALLGGSFNPPHVAHQMAAFWALAAGRVDRVWLVPCYQHAFNKALAPYEHRLEMCRLATRPFASGSVEVSTVEADIGGPSRTLHTLQYLISRHPDHRYSLLIGADILLETDSWYRFDEIERLVELLVVGRPGYPSPDSCVELAPVSSTEIRRRIAGKDDVSHLVPRGVVEYIARHQLYSAEASR